MDNVVVVKDQVALTMAASAQDLMAEKLVDLKDQVTLAASAVHKISVVSVVLKDQVVTSAASADLKTLVVSAAHKDQVALTIAASAQDLMADNLADQVTSAASADLKTLVVLVVLMMGINQVKAVQNSVVSAAHKISVVSVVLKDQVGLTMAASVAHKTLVASAQDLMADNLVDQVVLTMDTDQVKADQNLVDQVVISVDQETLAVRVANKAALTVINQVVSTVAVNKVAMMAVNKVAMMAVNKVAMMAVNKVVMMAT
jgi:hypothetical protein